MSFGSLSAKHPILDTTKISELHAYVYKFNPDVIILNETWLKPSILDSEILPANKYTMFRLDRSEDSHPADQTNPLKFKRNGGGVLIAVNVSLSLESKVIPTKCAAELLAVELILPNKSKVILAVLSKLSRKKLLRKFIVIGDFNLNGVTWATGSYKTSVEKEYIHGFANLGLLQCINEPTHKRGNTVDILLTTSLNHIKDIKIIDTERFCISDHFAITFVVTETIKRKPRVKRKCYNYKNANWDALNAELNMLDWDNLLNYYEPEIAWLNFKNILFSKIDYYIPKFTIKTEYQPPWFDSECYTKCKVKDKLHEIFKQKKTLESELKFKTAHREFKALVKSKMRENLDFNDRNVLTKKFWSHVKSCKNTSRIPEVISYEGITSSVPSVKADIFNNYFYKQFSEPSHHNIDIDFTNDSGNEIDLSVARVKSVLDSLDINKAQGPDAINGVVLKNCSKSLSCPLHKLFILAYNTGYLPSEWKLANVVPIHKKDDKSKVVNYRPISLTSLVMKIFERILYDELYSRTHEKINPRQHGFLKNKSCNSNLLTFTESIARSLREKIGTDVIYFDFAKAFDTVSHDLILQKLKA